MCGGGGDVCVGGGAWGGGERGRGYVCVALDFWAFITFIVIYVLRQVAFLLIMISVRPSVGLLAPGTCVCVCARAWVGDG